MVPSGSRIRTFAGARPPGFEGPATGLLVKLPGWLYPVVCDTGTGSLRYDNYNQAWGKQEHLDKFLQLYAVEKAGYRRRDYVSMSDACLTLFEY